MVGTAAARATPGSRVGARGEEEGPLKARRRDSMRGRWARLLATNPTSKDCSGSEDAAEKMGQNGTVGLNGTAAEMQFLDHFRMVRFAPLVCKDVPIGFAVKLQTTWFYSGFDLLRVALILL